MTWVAAGVMAAATVAGAYMTSNAQKDAASIQANAGLQAQNQLLQTGQQASGNFTPYQEAGTTALNNITGNLPYFTNQFSNTDLNANLAPNYAFQLQQGQAGTNAANNATGGMVSGNALQGLNQFNQNFAANAYQNAFNNYQAQRTNIYNTLAGIAGLGMQGATGSANAQIGVGTNIANVTQGIANAQAASTIGQANAISGGLSGIGNAYLYGNLMNNQTAGANTNSLGSINGMEGYQSPSLTSGYTSTLGNQFMQSGG